MFYEKNSKNNYDKTRILKFLNICFFDISYENAIKYLKKKGGYLVIPAASALANIINDKHYSNSLKKSTVAIFDSGLFCLLLLILKLIKVKKFSGYKFLNFFLNDKRNKKCKILLLEPSVQASKINNLYLKSRKFQFLKHYICPVYRENIFDKNLIKLINNFKPKFIIINIGGGTQEKLALYIKSIIYSKMIIICSGAALSFFSDNNSKYRITSLIDKIYMGWFIRVLNNPRFFIQRIFKSIKLIKIVFNEKIILINK
jgi:UDP-N-acetyl-D-mannosaminuronic acid transferase (WecB/TagA/CpsF family)